MVNNVHAVFSCLSDPTRADILQRLVDGPLTVGDIAVTYDISPPAISKHLRILEAAGLVGRQRNGRQQIIHLTPSATRLASAYLDRYRTQLSNRLTAFGQYFEQGPVIRRAAAPHPESPAMRELLSYVRVKGTPEAAWQVYTDPKHMAHWSPPQGTSVVLCENRPVVGGAWKLVVRNAAGQEYGIGGIYTEVEPYSRLTFSDGIGAPDSPRPEATVTVTFESDADGYTTVTRRSVATAAVHELNAAWFAVMAQ
jgi:uncharacterized protein YndB with AHSA1/START domain/DNA-binding MarR family transcriptional regulator